MTRLVITAALLLLAACSQELMTGHRTISSDACEISISDRAWIDRALRAWRLSSREITGIGQVSHFQAVFFDADCVLTSTNALAVANARDTIWTATPHSGEIQLPDGDQMPAGVTSFTTATDTMAYFVMSTPSVWRKGGVDGGPLGLETLMVAVLLHEGSHVAQSPTYGAQVTALSKRHALPESFNDDSLQEQFGADEAFSESIARETDLFFRAAAADPAKARRLAGEARNLMRARAARYFVADDSYWTEGEDLWLTFEGAGQWAGYSWLVEPRGASAPEEEAMKGFGKRSRWWSQNEGLAIVLALDKISPDGWRRHLYGDGNKTLLQILDAVLAGD